MSYLSARKIVTIPVWKIDSPMGKPKSDVITDEFKETEYCRLDSFPFLPYSTYHVRLVFMLCMHPIQFRNNLLFGCFIQEEEDEEGGDIEIEKKDPTHYSELDPKSMKLECRTMSSKGLKSQLIARLTKALKTEQELEEETATQNQETKEEEKKKEDEKKRGVLERRYTLPEKRCILVYPNAQAKGGKFDCSVMSLSDDEKKDSDKDEKKDKDDKKDEEKKDKDKKDKKEKRKFRTVMPDLLLSCIYFDQNHCGYIVDKDVEEIVHTIGLNLSRAQVKKLVQKVLSRDSFYYRKLTDEAIGEEDEATPKVEVEVDLEKLASGNRELLSSPKKDEPSTPGRRGRGATTKSDEPLTGMVMYNGAMLDIDSLLERLTKGDNSIADYEKKVVELEEEKEQAKKDLKRKEEANSKLASDLKTTKHELSVQLKITNSSESNNRKYLSALMETQNFVQNLANTVTGALGDMASIKVERVTDVKDEPIENGD
ncbi:CCAR1-like protein [Mya arenaria]|uniref:CCAR1-like protein n=1 Tax=Mya arenaria TaxID=6604 RepID=A0ABY7DFR6_MYAAR|nr:CCAR1-like protein [Mya arenaria]